jgi:hypothetical protein
MLSIQEERRREELWRVQTADVIRIASDRFHQIADVLGLDATSAEAFVSSAMEVTRQYQTGTMHANYEKRTGHPYPDEGRENEEAVWEGNWVRALAWLRETRTRSE